MDTINNAWNWSTDGDLNSGLRICNPAHSRSDIRAVFGATDKLYFNATQTIAKEISHRFLTQNR
tara:strand:- start:185 stop:376 length:192 start_codon:yes stop_codon:yes gene_type:complete